MARMGRFRISGRSKINIGRVITKIVVTVIALWVGGEIIDKVAVAINNTQTPFAKGLTLIGFGEKSDTAGLTDCNGYMPTTCLDGTVSTTGILSVVGIIAMASVVLDFVKVRMA